MRPPPSRPDIPPAVVAVAKASYQRCCAAPDFFACFYRNFFRACPEAEPLFARTNFGRQHKVLRHAIGLLLAFPGQTADDPSLLRRVAERHSRRDLNIDPSLYAPFVDSLIQTVREHDTECDAATEDAWRRALAPGVVYMQGRY
jgi:hemoglobin-like flavoprotein